MSIKTSNELFDLINQNTVHTKIQKIREIS